MISNQSEENQNFHIIDIDDQSVQFFRWPWWKLTFFIILYAIFAIITICGQAMIVYYVWKHAPKERTINRMIFLDQVISSTYVDKGLFTY